MFGQTEAAYEEVRRRQQELRERAARAQLLARVRRETAQAGRVKPGRRNWLARRIRADLARP
jgi:hypothetical protein